MTTAFTAPLRASTRSMAASSSSFGVTWRRRTRSARPSASYCSKSEKPLTRARITQADAAGKRRSALASHERGQALNGLERVGGQIRVGIEHDAELDLAREDHLQQRDGVEPEAAVGERRGGADHGRRAIRPRDAGHDRL